MARGYPSALRLFTLEGCQQDMATILCVILAMLWRRVAPPFAPLLLLFYYVAKQTLAASSCLCPLEHRSAQTHVSLPLQVCVQDMLAALRKT